MKHKVGVGILTAVLLGIGVGLAMSSVQSLWGHHENREQQAMDVLWLLLGILVIAATEIWRRRQRTKHTPPAS